MHLYKLGRMVVRILVMPIKILIYSFSFIQEKGPIAEQRSVQSEDEEDRDEN